MKKTSPNRVLTKIETVSFLHRLKQQDLWAIAEIFEITLTNAKKIRKDNNAFSEEKIDNAIRNLEAQIGFKNNEDRQIQRNYHKQDTCEHKDFKLMFKCACSKVLSENDIDEMIEILQRKKESLQVGVRVFTLQIN